MSKWTPTWLAKVGLVIFASTEVIRLLSSGVVHQCFLYVNWLGQVLLIGAAAWAAFMWPGNARLIRALSGLLFLMALVWPWFIVLKLELVGVHSSALARGVAPTDYDLEGYPEEAIQDVRLNLISGPLAAFPPSPHGCAMPGPRGSELVIVSTVSPDVQTAIWVATVLGAAISIAGAALAALNLFALAHSPADQAWVLAGVAAAMVIGALLIAQSPAWVLLDGCVAPSAARSMHRLQFWEIRLHPFGPAVLIAAGATFWLWPRRAIKTIGQRARLHLSLRPQDRHPDNPS
jgi:hypothetical protein